MKRHDLVSIILPTYNGAKYLRQSISSCLLQSHENIELIIVVDGSTDETLEILKEFNDSRAKLIMHEENRGLPASLNTGLKAAKGDYLSWTSDDNIYTRHAIEVLLNEIKSCIDSGQHLVYSNYFHIDRNDNILGRSYHKPEHLCVCRNNDVGACFLFTRRLFEETGLYDEGLQGVEDYEYWLRAHKQFAFRKIDRVLYYYRFHNHSLTSQHRSKILSLDEHVKRQHLECYRYEREVGENKVSLSDSFYRIGNTTIKSKEFSPKRLQDCLTSMQVSCVIVEPVLPRIFGCKKEEPRLDFLPGNCTVEIPAVVLSIVGLDADVSPEQIIRRIVQLGGSIGFYPESPTKEDMKHWPLSFWLRLGMMMNDYDNYSVHQIFSEMLRLAFKQPRQLRSFWYYLGMIVAKVPGLFKYVIMPKLYMLKLHWHNKILSIK